MKSLLLCLVLTSIIFGQGKCLLPIPKIPFELSYSEIYEIINFNYTGGRVDVEFTIDENGNVINSVITNTFNFLLNTIVLNKVNQSKYHPAVQNGIPVRVKYLLPILFK